MRALLLTLGHNSSAALIEGGRLDWAYETERLTGKKSDSSMPTAILKARGMCDKPMKTVIDTAYVVHWAPDGMLSSMLPKHWDQALFEDVPIRTLSADYTHHDAHIDGAVCYAGRQFPYGEGTIGLVVDGFGIFGEHVSLYDLTFGRPMLLKRYRGYDSSLGLWYQYATAFMGLKMHEDEYKLLGYEVYVDQALADKLDLEAAKTADEFVATMTKTTLENAFDPVYNIGALVRTREKVFGHLTDVVNRFSLSDPTKFDGRAAVAYYVQTVLECTIDRILKPFKFRHLICSGGVFYNVKLNNRLLNKVPHGLLCVYPLAGDQGNAVGMYAHDHPEFEFPSTLCWGHRYLFDYGGRVDGLIVTNREYALELVKHQLRTLGYVNLVRGSMEFGPRALCNTSTLAVPKMDIVRRINAANNRNTVMPMAPVMTKQMYLELFHHTERSWKSHHHMILAMEYKQKPEDSLLGITHEYKRPHQYFTGRPQVVDESDRFMTSVLEAVGHPLINTSFNYHGKPIAFDMQSIIENHRLQYARDPSFTTVVIHD